jgi:hypothetical protein
MNNKPELTERDQKLLEKLEQILNSDNDKEREMDSLYGFCVHLASTVPQADHSFQRQLEARLVAMVQQRQSRTTQSRGVSKSHKFLWSWRPLRWALTGSMLLLLLLGIMFAIPQTRAVLAAWLGFSFEQQVELQPLAVAVLDHDWRSPLAEAGDQSFEVYSVEFPEKRWTLIGESGSSTPDPGDRVMLPNGGDFPIPSYLPAGYHWQDIAAMQGNLAELGFPSLAHQSWAGGGSPMPPYDLSVDYLVGGDRRDRFLILTQLQTEGQQGLIFQVFHAAETHFGLIIQPAGKEQSEGVVFLVGSGDLQEVRVNTLPAWWYRGTWNAAGEWVTDNTWGNLVWEQEGRVYHLTGQDLPLEELVSIATSLPWLAQGTE